MPTKAQQDAAKKKAEEMQGTPETETKQDALFETEAEPTNEVAVQETAVGAPAEEDEYDLSGLGFDETELDNLSGLEAINASDIRVPYAKLYAKVATGFEVGDIELVDGTVIKGKEGEILQGLSVLKIQSVRIYFPEKYNKSNTFICRSFDNIVGAPDGKYAGVPCATCQFSKFPEEGGSSPCREQVLLLCTMPDGIMFYLLVSGIGVGSFKKQFMSVEMMKGLAIVKRKLKRQMLGALNLNVSVEMEETEYGPFPKLLFKVDKENPMVSPERLRANLESYGSYKEFEAEAVATAATFAQSEQGEHDPEMEAANQGQNKEAF